jgi:hypothetical protein
MAKEFPINSPGVISGNVGPMFCQLFCSLIGLLLPAGRASGMKGEGYAVLSRLWSQDKLFGPMVPKRNRKTVKAKNIIEGDL